MRAEREARENAAPSLPEDTLWVRFVFVDHAGIPKCKAVYRDGFGRRAEAGVGLAKGVLALDPGGALHPESGLSPDSGSAAWCLTSRPSRRSRSPRARRWSRAT